MFDSSAMLDRLARVIDEFQLASLQPQLRACRALASRREGVDVVVLGRFKAGKSSFLNHLAGRPVLPIGVVPLTAVVTRLRYGPCEQAQVTFLDGTARHIPLSEIPQYVDEKQNPNNVLHVATVVVDLPELGHWAPLEFVDTPGLGSALVHNTRVAMDWLPHVGAALVAVSADAPLSERDLGLLDELRRHTPRIALLLTKADLLTESQRTEVLDFVRQQIRARWNGPAPAEERPGAPPSPAAPTDLALPVFFYSIKTDSVDWRAILDERLLQPLRRRIPETAAQIVRHKLVSLAAQALNYLLVAQAAADRVESARQALRQKVAEERQQFDLLRDELQVLAREWDARAFEWTLERLGPQRQALEQRIELALRAELDGPWARLRLPAVLAAHGRWLEAFLKDELRALSQRERATFCAPLEQVRQHLERVVRALQDRLAEHVQEALGLTLARHEFQLEVPPPAAPPVTVGVAFDVTLDLVGYLIPMTVFKRWVHRRLIRQTRYEVRKNVSRLAAAWRDQISSAIAALHHQALQQVENELVTLEQTLARAATDAPALRQALAELEQLRAQCAAG